MATGREMIYAERLRQITGEGYTHAHDDLLADGVLEQAGYCYLYLTHALRAPAETRAILWPFHPDQWKPASTKPRNLVKAGALFLAEAERYHRQGKLDEEDRLFDMATNVAVEIDRL